jgi:hypothetical protein
MTIDRTTESYYSHQLSELIRQLPYEKSVPESIWWDSDVLTLSPACLHHHRTIMVWGATLAVTRC